MGGAESDGEAIYGEIKEKNKGYNGFSHRVVSPALMP